MSGPDPLLVVTAILILKRAIVGPLAAYARTGACLSCAGALLIIAAAGADDPLLQWGLHLILAGLAVWGLMFVSELAWIARHRRLPWQDASRHPGP
jgi:hypothetical protein